MKTILIGVLMMVSMILAAGEPGRPVEQSRIEKKESQSEGETQMKRSITDEVYVSTDVETDGPIPGPHSMLSFAAAAFTADKKLIATFSANLHLLPGAAPDPKTAAWWKTQPEAWEACRKDLQEPSEAMRTFVDWVKKLPGKPVFVGYPVAFDFLFVYWYMIRFAGESPFSHSALDIKTLAMALLKKPYRECSKSNMPQSWFDPLPHTHVALDDAIGQGALFCNILARLNQAVPTGSER